ncbi:hypothetical protein [Maribacter sp. HTCC2170]|uniref:hypothetical protein n=1 Tax=Maribacter sp. (strain HTCC2170 / KCCM 42371) TaxID=313603 RepID=UPI00006BD48A|nr:hypothetical protein [Maribacter sp. HTCC2170]EAR02296.1 hypothetical protein FB2170_03395 [Maribacter sp. HTCC2170]
MKTILSIILLILTSGKEYKDVVCISVSELNNEVLEKAPEFFLLDWEKGTVLTYQKTGLTIDMDSKGKHVITALVNKENTPVLYTSEIITPVCADGECKLMNIKVYWSLLGEYAGFDRYEEFPLTKHDHDEFAFEDYNKLHQLLKDNKSILARRSISELVEKPKMRNVNGIDAISGATITEVKESVVSGALYSCYTAWHIVHGEVRQLLRMNTMSVLNENMLLEMLYSSNTKYQMFALKKLDQARFKEHYIRISEVFTEGVPLVRSFIVKKIPVNIWNSPKLSQVFWDALPKIDVGSRSLLLDHLEYATPKVIEQISGQLEILTKNQIKYFLKILSEKETTQVILEKLTYFVNTNEIYGYLVKEYLDGL